MLKYNIKGVRSFNRRSDWRREGIPRELKSNGQSLRRKRFRGNGKDVKVKECSGSRRSSSAESGL